MPELRSMSHRTIVIAAVLAVAAAGGATAWAMSGSDGASYRLVAAAAGTVQQTISATGTISPVHSAAADFQVAGTVKRVNVMVGQHVTVGQVLASLDRSSFTSALRSAKSTLAEDRTRLSDDETGQSSPPSNGATANNRLLSSSPTVAASPSPTAVPTNSGSGGSGPAKSGSSGGSGGTSTVQQDQQAVLADQAATDAALNVASRALARVQSVCSTTGAAGQTGGSTTPSPTPTADSSACVEATTALAADQTAVSQAQEALAKSEQKLNDDLTAALKSATSQATKSSKNKSSSQGSVTPAATSSNVASAADLANDQAAIDQARASVASARADLREATLRSTIKGKVTAITVKHGDSVAGSSSSTSPAIQIVGAGQDQVTVALSASEVRHVRVGMTAHVSPDGVNHQLTGAVATINAAGSTSSSGSVSYPVTVTIPTSTALVSGAAANVSVIVATVNDVLTLPTSAIHHSGTSTYVYVLRKGKEVHRSITIGAIGAARTEITSGLSADQHVVLANLKQKLPSSSSTLTRDGGFGRNGLSDLTGGGALTVVNGGPFPTGGVSGGPPNSGGK